jgi:hypothetical protein
MGEKQELRAKLADERLRHSVVRAERLRSDVATLTDRLEDTLTRLRDRRAFNNGVADLARLVTRLTNMPAPNAETVAYAPEREESWTRIPPHRHARFVFVPTTDGRVPIPVHDLRVLLTDAGYSPDSPPTGADQQEGTTT